MKVYIAGSTAEIDRAKSWGARLQRFGIEVISTWTTVVGEHGCNPRDASLQQRRTWALDDIDQIRQADLFWLLVPALDRPSRGAWFELGVAWTLIAPGCKQLIASGDTRQSIFCALAGREFDDDVDAFIEIVAQTSTRP